MNSSVIPGSIALNVPQLGCTTTDALATPLHRLPLVVPGRYANAHNHQLVDVTLVDAKGVHFFEMQRNDEDQSILERAEESKLMNTAVFALSHHPL